MNVYLLLILFILLVFHISIRYSRSGRMIHQIPGPSGLPIIGNLFSFFNVDSVYLWQYLRRNFSKYYPIAKIRIVTYTVVASQDPDDLKVMLTDRVNVTKGKVYEKFEIWAKNGLITSKGDLWRYRRKILTPAFGPVIMKRYLEVMEEHGQKFIDGLSAKGDESVQELIPLVSRYTLCVICGTVMGVDLSQLEHEADEYKKAVSGFFEAVVYKAFKPYIPEWLLNHMEIGKKEKACLATLRSFADKVIAERQKYHEENKTRSYDDFVNNVDDTASSETREPRRRLVMLDILLAAKDKGLIDDQGVRDEVDTFIVAGFDTTSMALVYILMSLAENKEVQEKARAEAFAVMDRCLGDLTMDDVKSLDYVERCVKESLRILPSVPLILRNIEKEIKMKNLTVPKGVEFAMSIYDIQRNPTFWKDPEKFDPDRFLPENSKDHHPYAYLPFSSGPRICIGQKFAMMELKSLVAKILYNFSIEPVENTKDIQFEMNIVLLPTSPVHVKFVKLKKEK